jgi:hypothetical protein
MLVCVPVGTWSGYPIYVGITEDARVMMDGGRGGRGRGRGRGGRRGPGRQVAFMEQHQDLESAETASHSNATGNQRGGNAGARFGGRRYGGGRT